MGSVSLLYRRGSTARNHSGWDGRIRFAELMSALSSIGSWDQTWQLHHQFTGSWFPVLEKMKRVDSIYHEDGDGDGMKEGGGRLQSAMLLLDSDLGWWWSSAIWDGGGRL